MFNIGSQELLIILLLVFIFFGPRHLPEVARTLGRGLGDLQRSLKGVEDKVRRASEETIGRPGPSPSIFDPALLEERKSEPAAPIPGVIPVAPSALATPAGDPEGEEGDPEATSLNPS